MKVGVFFANEEPIAGGGFTFQDSVLQALSRLESKHSFVIFSDLTKEQTTKLASKQFLFVSSQRSLPGLVRFNLTRVITKVARELPITRNWLRGMRAKWLSKAAEDLGVEAMWFVGPYYAEIDIPYIFTVWDLQHRLQPWFPEVSAKGEWRERERIYATAIPRASAVIIGNEAGRAEIVQFYQVPPERVKLIPHPTPEFALRAPKDSVDNVLATYGIPAGYLFYPAQFWPHKNHIGLLLAVNILREEHNLSLPVVFIGSDKGNLQYVRRVVDELGLSAQVHFLGFVPQEDLIGLYRNAFALTYVTFFGPENMPPLEAFALGCPVIASNVSGAEEQLGDAALLVEPKNERQIADAIKRLHDDSILRDTLVSRGVARASKWTAEDFVKSILSLIDELEPIRRCWGKPESP